MGRRNSRNTSEFGLDGSSSPPDGTCCPGLAEQAREFLRPRCRPAARFRRPLDRTPRGHRRHLRPPDRPQPLALAAGLVRGAPLHSARARAPSLCDASWLGEAVDAIEPEVTRTLPKIFFPTWLNSRRRCARAHPTSGQGGEPAGGRRRPFSRLPPGGRELAPPVAPPPPRTGRPRPVPRKQGTCSAAHEASVRRAASKAQRQGGGGGVCTVCVTACRH